MAEHGEDALSAFTRRAWECTHHTGPRVPGGESAEWSAQSRPVRGSMLA
ncbi:MAG: hypothetical protein L3K19_02755 [Thermoplasmata archaeon]|nr:hypothetical protein [Thermoplasmata archaeon]